MSISGSALIRYQGRSLKLQKVLYDIRKNNIKSNLQCQSVQQVNVILGNWFFVAYTKRSFIGYLEFGGCDKFIFD
jgi:hypothetical protein